MGKIILPGQKKVSVSIPSWIKDAVEKEEEIPGSIIEEAIIQYLDLPRQTSEPLKKKERKPTAPKMGVFVIFKSSKEVKRLEKEEELIQLLRSEFGKKKKRKANECLSEKSRRVCKGVNATTSRRRYLPRCPESQDLCLRRPKRP